MELQDIATINFVDKAESQNACMIIRRYGQDVALCVSLESDGDVEVLISAEDAKKLIVALEEALVKK